MVTLARLHAIWKAEIASSKKIKECEKWIESGKALRERLVNDERVGGILWPQDAVEEAPIWLYQFERFVRQNFETVADYNQLTYFSRFEKPANESLNDWAAYYQRCVGFCYGQISVMRTRILRTQKIPRLCRVKGWLNWPR